MLNTGLRWFRPRQSRASDEAVVSNFVPFPATAPLGAEIAEVEDELPLLKAAS
jgi:hypothetical protein